MLSMVTFPTSIGSPPTVSEKLSGVSTMRLNKSWQVPVSHPPLNSITPPNVGFATEPK
jgi:hypothetical protein